MDASVQQAFDEYMRLEQNGEFRKELQSLADEGNNSELRKCLLGRMEFGTAGLRARMGPGFCRMNDLTLLQTTQGLVRYLKSDNPSAASAVVGFDGRRHSSRWAKLVAHIFSQAGLKVHLYSGMTPTPFVPFAVRHYSSAVGVMITASHNPKQDNGYKVYWNNGAQIMSPRDAGISECILQNLVPWPGSFDFDSVSYESDRIVDPLAEISALYVSAQRSALCYTPEANAASQLRIVYSAMHGVGCKFVQQLLGEFQFPKQNLILVPEQAEPDADFPTVTFPNPEEQSSMKLACKLADELQCPVVLANDPDADRLAIAERSSGSSQWHIFTGNEIATLIGWWLLQKFKQHNPQVTLSDCYFLFSTVSSKILATIAKREGCQVKETLTGFKYMGNESYQLLGNGKHVLFAFEEAIGFMCGSVVLDKDGVSAAAVAAELASYVHATNSSLLQQLQLIFSEYGHHMSNNGYFFSYNPANTQAMFQQLREPQYPAEIAVDFGKGTAKVKILAVRDVTNGYDSAREDQRCEFGSVAGSEMITFTFQLQQSVTAVLTLRTSGTEPKIKWYSEIIGFHNASDLQQQLNCLVQAVHQHFVQPQRFQFQLMQT